jgi:hypothetical protein
MKKIAIIGKGTAGVLALTHFTKYCPQCEISLYFDENIKPQPVGEGSTLIFPKILYTNIGFVHSDLNKIDGYFKSGIKKTGWAGNGNYIHNFTGDTVAYHFNASKLQSYIIEKLKDKIKLVEGNIKHENIDADFILDSSGKPSNYDDFYVSDYICVNSVHVNQCYWDYPRFTETLTLARPYGWVFGIPLQNRCSIGYLYNNTINTLEEVKEDIKNVFKEYNLVPSDTINSFSFKNYYKKEIIKDRVVYNGNAGFFLEPIEATSIATMEYINRTAFSHWFENKDKKTLNEYFLQNIRNIENMIMLHYYAGSKFNTPFWTYAKKRGKDNIENIALNNSKFKEIINVAKLSHDEILNYPNEFGTWGANSFKENLIGLGLYDKI